MKSPPGARDASPRPLSRIEWIALALGGLPLAATALEAATAGLGPDPITVGLDVCGGSALVFLLASLAVTPARRLTGLGGAPRLRRILGLLCFGYAVLHLAIFVALDEALSLEGILDDVHRRPFIAGGMVTFLLLVPLAATSTDRAVRRLGGARWKALHRLAYLAAPVATVHFFFKVKGGRAVPLAFGAALVALLALRALPARHGPAAGDGA